MPDLIKIPSAAITHENMAGPRAGSAINTNIPNIPDITRVTEPNTRNLSGGRQSKEFFRNFESNYDNFLHLLRSLPEAGQLYKEIFFLRMGLLVKSGMDENFAEEISEYMKLLKMTDTELVDFLKSQINASTKFSAPAFDIFREIFSTTKSDTLKTAILDTLRKLDGMTSRTHILNEILSNLKNIATHMPEVSARALNDMRDALSKSGADNQGVMIIKNEIIPFLAKYIGVTHDFGAVRDLITMLTFNVARYEYCSEEGFMKSLNSLMAFEEFSSKLPPERLKSMVTLWTSGKMHNVNNSGGNLIDKLIGIIAKGMETADPQSRPIFENLVQSILINESVHMPLLHIILPADINGRLFFSEIWIDPDAEDSDTRKANVEKTIKLLIKFDIKSVGYFEVIILAKGESVDLQLFYPESFSYAREQIKAGISDIVQRNQLSLNSLSVKKFVAPKFISEVFPKIFERKNTVDVII